MTTPDEYAEYERKLAAVAECEAIARPLNKAALFDALASAGVGHVTVCFDGCGDSGQIESVVACTAGGVEITLPAVMIEMRTVGFDGPSVTVEQRSVAEAVEILSYAYLGETHGGWENDDGAYGVFTFSVADRMISLDYNERYTATNFSAHAF